MALPPDYLERVYAGVLGKLIGVYLGRPFEGWTYQRILKELGPIRYYVNDRFNEPIVVVDDDISGTFTFPRALEEHGVSPNITSEAIGNSWLNNVIERRTIFWWGGNGISTEHTAYLNLKKGIKAPHSGSIQTNGKTVAEQIGAQIFIDGWAMLAPGQPELAVKLAEAAAKVSHDEESVYAATMLAAMESEAFISKDVDHLLDIGLLFIPEDSLIAQLISDVRVWHREDNDWQRSRHKIEDKYGYDKFSGICHVVPNHGIMILALLYGSHSFHEAIHIVNTCGWDTDCNSGNIGCLVAIMHGLKAFEGGPDWRGPIADRALISSADAGYSINNAARIAYNLTNLGRQLAGESHLEPPKGGAQFHFTLPGSVQGFEAAPLSSATIEQVTGKSSGVGCLAIRISSLTTEDGALEILTPTFTPPEVTKTTTYELMASPLIYPGQSVRVLLRASTENTSPVKVQICRKSDGRDYRLKWLGSMSWVELAPGTERELDWTIPDDMDRLPILKIGIALQAISETFTGLVWLEYLKITGTPQLRLERPCVNKSDFWQRAWVNNVSIFHSAMPQSFYLSQDEREGMLSYGTREWTDYRIQVKNFRVNLGAASGIAVRVQGLRRYYACLFVAGERLSFVKVMDDSREELSSTAFSWRLDQEYEVVLNVKEARFSAQVDGKELLMATDSRYQDGGIGFIVSSGSVSAEMVEIGEPV